MIWKVVDDKKMYNYGFKPESGYVYLELAYSQPSDVFPDKQAWKKVAQDIEDFYKNHGKAVLQIIEHSVYPRKKIFAYRVQALDYLELGAPKVVIESPRQTEQLRQEKLKNKINKITSETIIYYNSIIDKEYKYSKNFDCLEHDHLFDLQIDAINLILSRKEIIIGAEAGCLSGDTLINYRSSKQTTRTVTIEELYYRFNRIPRKGKNGTNFAKSDAIFKVAAWNENYSDSIVYQPIKDVVQSGIKPVYLVTTKKGRQIKTTLDHKFLTENKIFKPLSGLEIGSKVWIRPNKSEIPRTGRIKRNKYFEFCVNYHPAKRSKTITANNRKGEKIYSYIKYRVRKSHVVYEAYVNNLSLEDYLNALNTFPQSELDKFWYIPKGSHIHHMNENHEDNRIENLQLLSLKEHNQIHGKSHIINTKDYIIEDEITNIEFVDNVMTYDICCEEPNHNFIANDLVVHNSGKTSIGLVASKYLIDFRTEHVLVITLKSTIEQWKECAEVEEMQFNTTVINYEALKNLFKPALDQNGNKTYVINPKSKYRFLLQKKIKVVLLDEIHKVRNLKSDIGQVMKFFLDYMNIPHRVGLTGTPYYNAVHDLLGILSNTTHHPIQQLTEAELSAMLESPRATENFRKQISLSHWYRILDDYGIKLPDLDFEFIEIQPDESLIQAYQKIIDEGKQLMIQRHGTEQVINTTTQKIRVLSAKHKRELIKKMILDEPGQLVVMSSFNEALIYPLGKELDVPTFTGKLSSKERQKLKERFKNQEVKTMLINYGAGSTGLDGLQRVCGKMILAEPVWEIGTIKQGIARLRRLGGQDKVKIVMPYLAKTDDFLSVEAAMIQSLNKKLTEFNFYLRHPEAAADQLTNALNQNQTLFRQELYSKITR